MGQTQTAMQGLWMRLPSLRSVSVVALVVLLALIVLWPIIMLLYGSFRTSTPLAPGEWSLDAYRDLWATVTTDNALQNSMLIAVVATPLSGIIGVGLALIVERTNSPLRRLVTPVAVIVAVMQGVIYVVGWSLLGNSYSGIVNVLYRSLGAAPGDYLVDIESWAGLISVQALQSAAIVYLLVLGPIRALDRAHDEASLTAGASRLRTTLLVTLPMLAPIITGVMLIGLLAEFMSLPTGLVLGGPAGITLLPVQVYENLNATTPPPYADAAAVSFVLVVVTMLLLLLQSKLLGRRSFTTVSGKPGRGDVWRLGRWRWLAGGILGSFIVVALVLPLGAIVLASFQPFPGVMDGLSFRNYRSVIASNGIGPIITNTALVAILVGLLSVALAFGVAYTSLRTGRRTATFLRVATVLPIALPGIVGPIAVLWGFVSLPGARSLFGTIWLVIIALVVRALPITFQLGSSAIKQVARDLEDAATVSGQNAFRAAVGITGRLLLPSFMAGWFMAGLLAINNLEIPLMLGGSQSETVATRIYGLYVGSQPSQGAALLVMTVGGLALIGALGLLTGKFISWVSQRRTAATAPTRTGPKAISLS